MINELFKYGEYLIRWIRDQVKTSPCQTVITGVSGGIDSALVALLAKKAFGKKAQAVFLPCHSPEIDYQCVKDLQRVLQSKIISCDLSSVYDQMISCTKLEKKSQKTLMNIKPRLRMTALYALAQDNNALVLGTDNAAEWHLGYFTKYGDGGVDLLPIIHLSKKAVYELAKIHNAPASILERAPSAALFPGQTDEAEIGVTYNEVDAYLAGNKVTSQIAEIIQKWHLQSVHKRSSVPQPKKPSNNFATLVAND